MLEGRTQSRSYRLSDADKMRLEELARRLETSETEVLRQLIRNAFAAMVGGDAQAALDRTNGAEVHNGERIPA